MKKYGLIILAALLAAFVVSPAFAGNPWTGTAVITVATDNTTSAALALPTKVSRIAVQVPTLTSGTVKIKASVDGTTYQDLYCTANTSGTSLLWTVPSGTGAINNEVPCEMSLWKYIKFVTSAEQAANRTFTVYGVAPFVDTRVP